MACAIASRNLSDPAVWQTTQPPIWVSSAGMPEMRGSGDLTGPCCCLCTENWTPIALRQHSSACKGRCRTSCYSFERALPRTRGCRPVEHPAGGAAAHKRQPADCRRQRGRHCRRPWARRPTPPGREPWRRHPPPLAWARRRCCALVQGRRPLALTRSTCCWEAARARSPEVHVCPPPPPGEPAVCAGGRERQRVLLRGLVDEMQGTFTDSTCAVCYPPCGPPPAVARGPSPRCERRPRRPACSQVRTRLDTHLQALHVTCRMEALYLIVRTCCNAAQAHPGRASPCR